MQGKQDRVSANRASEKSRAKPLAIAVLFGLLCLRGFFVGVSSSAQQTTTGQSSATKAQQVPLSGRTQSASGVQTQSNSTGNGSNASVDTINSTIQVSGSYQGSVRDHAAQTSIIALTMADAVGRGLLYNLGGQGASASLKQARARRLAALSQLLPNIYATLSETGAKVDLQTQGLTPALFGGSVALPTTVGPFHYYSALANMSEDVSITSRLNLRSASSLQEASASDVLATRELIVLAVGGMYVRILASVANVTSQEGQIKQAEASYKQASARFEAGTNSIVDKNKSLVELRTQQEQLTSLRGDLVKQKMQLARMIGLSPGVTVSLTEGLPADIPSRIGVDDAIAIALRDRQDLKAARKGLEAALAAKHAARSEYLPSLSVSGYYGLQGINPNAGRSVFQAQGSINIPLFQSGRVKADIEQADASVDQRRAEYEDQEGAVELAVRQTFVDLQVAMDEVVLARQNQQLAAETLKQSIDRFDAGVTSSVEVVQSQQTVTSAERDYVSSLFSLSLSRISLAQSMGQAEKFVPDMLKGK